MCERNRVRRSDFDFALLGFPAYREREEFETRFITNVSASLIFPLRRRAELR
jgi:hypothetical protein